MKFFLNKNGFSLIEVLLTFSILVVFFILFQAVIDASIINRNVKHQEQALRIAQTQTDNLQSFAYDSLPPSGSFSDPLLASLPQGTASMTVIAFNDKVKQVTVVVGWQEPGFPTAHSVSLVTLIGEGGL